MITDVRFEGFIGIFDTLYNTQPLIDYWKYQDKIGSTFKRKGIFGKDRKPHMRKDTCFTTEDFMVDHNAGYIFIFAKLYDCLNIIKVALLDNILYFH